VGRWKTNNERERKNARTAARKKFFKKYDVAGHIAKPGELLRNPGRMMNYYTSFEVPYEVVGSDQKPDTQTWYCCGEYHTFPTSTPKEEVYQKLLAVCEGTEAPDMGRVIMVQDNVEEVFVAKS
jgi:hypothetical protein